MYNRQQSVKTVAIAIPSLHRPDLTARCIESIQQQTLPAEQWEIIVIENAAEAGKMLPDPLPRKTSRIELPTNEGTTASINRAVRESDSVYVLLLNNDVELAPDYLEKLVAAMDDDFMLGFATGKLVRSTDRTRLDGAGDAMLVAGAAYRLGHLAEDRGQYSIPFSVASGCGAAVLYRRESFVSCGMLDEDFFAYLDDLDLALRTQIIGFDGVCVPDAVAYHVGSATYGVALDPRVVELVTRNQIWLLVKDYPRPLFLGLFPRVLIYQFLWMLFAIRHGGMGAYFRGMRAAIRGLGLMHRKYGELMAKRKIPDSALLAKMRMSERQVYEWQQSLPKKQRSSLLSFYFRLFGAPPAAQPLISDTR